MLSLARISTIAVIVLLLALLAVFLYRDFYQTIIQAKVVIVLKQEVALEDINIKTFKEVLKVHTYKISPGIKNYINDPFNTTRANVDIQ